jgi:hypothetical protein
MATNATPKLCISFQGFRLTDSGGGSTGTDACFGAGTNACAGSGGAVIFFAINGDTCRGAFEVIKSSKFV